MSLGLLILLGILLVSLVLTIVLGVLMLVQYRQSKRRPDQSGD